VSQQSAAFARCGKMRGKSMRSGLLAASCREHAQNYPTRKASSQRAPAGGRMKTRFRQRSFRATLVAREER
jgi:hypothetical protein